MYIRKLNALFLFVDPDVITNLHFLIKEYVLVWECMFPVSL